MIPPCGANSPLASLITQIQGRSEFSTLLGLIRSAPYEILDTLSGPGPFTLFAPTNTAIKNANLPATVSSADIAAILTLHVVNGRILSSDLTQEQGVPSLSGEILDIVVGADITINGHAKVIANQSNIQACNAVVHTIDHLLVPTCSQDAPLSTIKNRLLDFIDLTSIGALLQKTGELGYLAQAGPMTFFAPNDAAVDTFTAGNFTNGCTIPQILLHHMVSGARYLPTDFTGPVTSISMQDKTTLEIVNVEGTISIVNPVSNFNGLPNVTVVNASPACNGNIIIVDQVRPLIRIYLNLHFSPFLDSDPRSQPLRCQHGCLCREEGGSPPQAILEKVKFFQFFPLFITSRGALLHQLVKNVSIVGLTSLFPSGFAKRRK